MTCRFYRTGLFSLMAAALLFNLPSIASSATGGEWQEPPTQQMQQAPPAKRTGKSTRRRSRGKSQRARTGVPTGVHNCIDRLTEVAAADPLPSYEGQPEQIINDGLMWSDEKSKCSIGTDSALRLKVLELSTAWRMKDAAKVRSLLGEIKQAVPQT
jgi:hypothetical protein